MRWIDLRPRASADIDEIADYIARDNLTAACRFQDAVTAALEQLADSPFLGEQRHYRNPRVAGLRFWLIPGFPNYVIFYRPFDDRIEVVRIMHSARDYDSMFERMQ